MPIQRPVSRSLQAPSVEQQQAIAQFNQRLVEVRQQLRDVRGALRGEIDALGDRLRLINILAVPTLIVLAGIIISAGSATGSRAICAARRPEETIVSARGFVILLLATVLAVIVAIVAAVQPTISAVTSIAGEPMFPALGQQAAASWQGHRPDSAIHHDAGSSATASGSSPERGDYPARKSRVADLVASLSRMTKVEPKTANRSGTSISGWAIPPRNRPPAWPT